jgi:hypothetical protein
MKKTTTPTTFASSYWLRDFGTDSIFDSVSDEVSKSRNIYRLASNQRAIGNFVSIVTNKTIPVTFATAGNSYTDGERVVISSNIETPKEFDVAVGLALHEGSHIKLSNFELLKRLSNYVHSSVSRDVQLKAEVLRVNSVGTVKQILNYIEDRRIDQYIFDTAPGYRDYYRALYDKYFNDPIITKALNSDEFTDETMDSYEFRLINLHSTASRLSALKALTEIYKLIDLANINRLKTTDMAFDVAIGVFELIINAVYSEAQLTESESKSNSDVDGGDEAESASVFMASDEPSSASDSSLSSSDMNGSGDTSEGNQAESDNGNNPNSDNGESSQSNTSAGASNETAEDDTDSNNSNESDEATEILTQNQKKQLPKRIQKQRDFIAGDIKKKKISKSESRTIEAISASKTEISVVGEDVRSSWGRIQNGIQCIVVNKLTESLIETREFPLRSWRRDDSLVNIGIKMGVILGKRLQTRSETRETVYNRQKNGRLDRRLISSLGFGNEQVFYTKEIDSFKKSNLHFSIDASSSMDGAKWENSMITAVALAKAVDMIPNLSIQLSFRTVSGELPYVVIAYDSRVDKFSKIKKLFPSIRPTGTTPEGLCYEAIMKQLVPATTEIDSYFLNISDGEPYFSTSGFSYYDEPAARHTNAQIKKMEERGIKILSYFVSDRYVSDRNKNHFKQAYGTAASFVDVSNVQNIIKTMNELFLNK